MATARWVLPVPPTSTMLRLASKKPPMARSRIRGSLTGEAAKSKSASSLAAGSLADAIWYLIERAVLSAISALSRAPKICCAGWRRLSPSARMSS